MRFASTVRITTDAPICLQKLCTLLTRSLKYQNASSISTSMQYAQYLSAPFPSLPCSISHWWFRCYCRAPIKTSIWLHLEFSPWTTSASLLEHRLWRLHWANRTFPHWSGHLAGSLGPLPWWPSSMQRLRYPFPTVCCWKALRLMNFTLSSTLAYHRITNHPKRDKNRK